MSSLYNQLIELGDDRKIIAATEVGAAPLPDLLQLYEAHWSWFCTWVEPFINDPEWNSIEDLQTVRDQPVERHLTVWSYGKGRWIKKVGKLTTSTRRSTTMNTS